MTTATSCSSKTKFTGMYGSVLRRNAPLGIFYGVLMLALFPLIYILGLLAVHPEEPRFAAENIFYGAAGVYTGMSGVAMALICAIVPIVMGVVVFSYLHNKKATDVYHALPMRRESLFSANYFAGLTLLWVPVVASFLVILLAGGVNASKLGWVYSPAQILVELLCWLVVVTVIYTITALVAVLAGNSFDTVLFSLGLNGMYPVILIFAKMTTELLLVGFNRVWNLGIMSETNMLSLSPFTLMVHRISSNAYAYLVGGQDGPTAVFQTGGRAISPIELWNSWAIAVWAVLSVGLFFLAIALYKRRKSERAGCTTSASVLNRILQYALTFVCSMALGMIMSETITGKGSGSMMFLTGVIIGGAIAFATFEAITARGFKTFPKAFVQMGIAVGASALFVVLLITGGLGYETRVPALENIQSVTINYNGRYERRELYDDIGRGGYGPSTEQEAWRRNSVRLETPEAIALVREVHAATLVEMRGKRMRQNDINWEEMFSISPEITYTLKNGKKLARDYRYCTVETGQKLLALEDMEEFKRQTHPAFLIPPERVGGVRLTDRIGAEDFYQALTAAQSKALVAALQQDALGETLAQTMSGGAQALGYLTLEINQGNYQNLILPENRNILVTAASTNTLAALRELGLQDKFAINVDKISKAAVSLNGPKDSYNFRRDGYYVVNPSHRWLSSNEIFNPNSSESSQWLATEEPAEIQALFDKAKNYGKEELGMISVYFQYEGKSDLISLAIVTEDLPPALAKRYAPESDAATTKDGEAFIKYRF